MNVLFSMPDTVKLGSLKWARHPRLLEPPVRVMRKTPLRLRPFVVVAVKLPLLLCEVRMING
jgi:hypothetical protein